MKCMKCHSENLAIVQSGPHKKLVCQDCLSFQKFLSKADAKVFEALHKPKEEFHDSPALPQPTACLVQAHRSPS